MLIPKLFLSREFLYTQLCRIIEGHRSDYRKHVRYLIALYMFYIYRFYCILTQIVRLGPDHVTSNVDIFVYFFAFFSTNRDWLFGLTFIMLFVFSLLSHVKLYRAQMEKQSWQVFADLFLRVWETFRLCQIRIPKSLTAQRRHRFSIYLLKKSNIYSKIKLNSILIDKKKLQKCMIVPFRVLPQLSTTNYGKLLKTLVFEEILCNVVITIVVAAIISFECLFLYRKWNQFDLTLLPVAILNIILFTYLIIKLIQIAVLYGCIAFTSSIYYVYFFGELNRLLRKAANGQLVGRSLSSFLTRFMNEHTYVSMLIFAGNRAYWNDVILIALISQVPTNVYLIYRILVYSSMNFAKTTLSWIILLNQFTILLSSLWFCAKSSKVIHLEHKLLPRVQERLGSVNIRLKLKCLTIYERLSGKPIGLSIGATMHTITYRTVFEVLLVYIGFMLTLFNIFR